PQELDDLIEDLLDDEKLRELTERANSFYSARNAFSAVAVQNTEVPPYLVELAPNQKIADLMRFAHRVEDTAIAAALQFLTHRAREKLKEPDNDEPEPQTLPYLWFLTDLDIPLEWKQIFLARTKAEIAQDALFTLALVKSTQSLVPPPGMIERLTKIWID